MPKMAKDDTMPWISPAITVKDVEAGLKFYADAFSFEPAGSMQDDDGNTNYAHMLYKGQMVLMMMPEMSWGKNCRTPASTGVEAPIGLYVYCDDVDVLYQQAKQSGAKVVEEPVDMFWGDRLARLQDPDGYVWTFATKVAEYQQVESAGA